MSVALRAFVFLCFFFTGAFGLVYEVAWSRYLALLIGNTAYAYTAVIATFMGGLALGAWLLGRWADRLCNRLRAYGWLECAVGFYAAIFPTIFDLFERLLTPLGKAAGIGTPAMAAFKFGCAVLCILAPTILMGGTLPILTRGLTGDMSGLRRAISALYGLNSAGAVVGCLLAGFYLLPTWGLPAATGRVGVLNAALGLAVALLAGAKSLAASEAPAEGVPNAADEIVHDQASRRAAVIIAGLSGFAGLALEIAWIRYFALVLGSSANAFTVMLAAFISGIAAGSLWLSSRRASRIPLMTILVGALLGAGFFLTASLELYGRLPFLLWRLRLIFRPTLAAYPYYQTAVYLACFACMFVPTFASGLAFPAAVRLASRGDALGGGVGRVYALNTVGSLVGATATSLLLFSWIGLENIFRLLTALYLLAAGALALRFMGKRGRFWAGAAAALLAVHLLAHHPIQPLLLNLGFYMRGDAPADFAAVDKIAGEYRLLAVREGPHAMVTVREQQKPGLAGPTTLALVVNGKVDASTHNDMYTQMLLAHLPMLLHPDPRDVFVVGLGSGVSAGSALTHGARVDVAEISREVVDAERFFEPYNRAPLQNPNVRLFLEDAKTALQFTDRQYDLVLSEPTNPWISGIAGLFSREFYDRVKARLRPGGVFAQWMPSYFTTDEAMSVVVATLLDRFRHVYIFQTLPTDYLFVAADHALAFDPAAFAARVAQPAVAADLARIHADNPAVLLSTQVKDSLRLRVDFPGARVNSDYQPLLEYRAPLGLFLQQSSALLANLDDRETGEHRLFLDRYLRARPLTAADVRALIAFYDPNVFGAASEKWSPLLRLSRRLLGVDAPETQYLFALAASKLPLAAPEHWDSFALPAHPTVPGAMQRLEAAIIDYTDGYFSWAPPPTDTMVALADWLDARHADVVEWRARLVRETCMRGERTVCLAQAEKLENQAIAASRKDLLAEATLGRFECAVHDWDRTAAQAELAHWRELGLPEDDRWRSIELWARRLGLILDLYGAR
jgi:spermidine synthase